MAKIYLLCGKVGCGKSRYANQLKQEKQAIILSCDKLMLRLFDECIGREKHQEFLARCKSFLYEQAEELLTMGHDVVLDFGFWSKAEREQTTTRFRDLGFETELIYCNPPYDVITKQLEQRNYLVEQGKIRAYHIDTEKRQRFDSWFEEPEKEEKPTIIE